MITILLYLLAGLLLLVLLVHYFCYFFFGKAQLASLGGYLREDEAVTFQRGKYLVFSPRGTVRAGLVFNPGGYVDPEAYARILSAVAHQGILCVAVPGPLRTPIANRFSADKVMAQFPEVDRWFMAGHSQGGAVASLYVRDRHTEKNICGLIFLGFFVFDRHSLAHLDIPALTVFGDRDGHYDKFEPNHKNLPRGATIVKIEGGNHGQFGHYGLHFPDGKPTITREEQQDKAITAINEFIEKVLR